MGNKLYTGENIEVFILTGNRLNFFKDSLDSILKQTVKDIKITVINNTDADDGTELYVNSLQKMNSNIHYFRQNCRVSPAENLETAKSLVSKDYVMFFHDDDILHSQYIEAALSLLNSYENVDLICSLLHSFTENDEVIIKPFEQFKYRIFKNKYEFTKHIWVSYCTDGTSLCFPNLIYKSENLKSLTIQRDKYGRASDKPIVINFLNDGICIQFLEKDFFFYRNHSLQDTNAKVKSPNVEQIIEYLLFFKEKLNKDLYSVFLYSCYSLKWAISFYKWSNLNTDFSVYKFVKILRNKKVISNLALLLYFLPTKLMTKPYNYIARNWLSKTYRRNK